MSLLPLGWADLSAPGILALVVVMILTGWLVPRRTYRDAVDSRDYERKRADSLEARFDGLDERFATFMPLLTEASRRGALPPLPATVVTIPHEPTPAHDAPEGGRDEPGHDMD